MPGEVTRQLGHCEADLIAYAHSLNKKFKSMNDILVYHYDRALKILQSNAKNPFRTEPLSKKARGDVSHASGVASLGALGMSENQLAKVAAENQVEVGSAIFPKKRQGRKVCHRDHARR